MIIRETVADAIQRFDPQFIAAVKQDADLSKTADLSAENPNIIFTYPGFKKINSKRMLDFEREFLKSLSKLTDNDPKRAVMMSNKQRYDTLDYYSIVAKYGSLFYFFRNNSKVFYFNNDLVSALMDTDIDSAIEYLKLPFASVMFSYDSRQMIDLVVQCANYKKGEAKIDADQIDSINIILAETPDANQVTLGMMTISVFFNYKSKHIEPVIIAHRELRLRPDSTLKEAMMEKRDYEATFKDNPDKSPKYIDPQGIKAIYEDKSFINLFQTVLNGVLYIQSSSPSLTSYPVKSKNEFKQMLNTKRAEASVYRSANTPFIYVGSNFAHNSVQNSGTSGSHLTSRFKVRGHWRNQPFGENLRQRKLIWIQPFWKGPEIGQVINRNYKVKL